MTQVIVRSSDDSATARLEVEPDRDAIWVEQYRREAANKAAGRDEERFRRVTQLSLEQTRGANLDPVALIREDRDR